MAMFSSENPFEICIDYIDDRVRVKGLLADFFSMDDRIKGNLLLMCYDIGIVEEIKKAGQLDNSLKNRMVNNVISQYGISLNNAEWAVEYWFEQYAIALLNMTGNYTQTPAGKSGGYSGPVNPPAQPIPVSPVATGNGNSLNRGKVIRDIFRAIYTGKWIEIEYRNKQGGTTCYWIGIKDILPANDRIIVDGFKVDTQQIAELNIFISSIIKSNIVEGSYYGKNESLINDIEQNEVKYEILFENISNLKLFNYYADCCKLDNSPQKVSYALLDKLNIETLPEESPYKLSDEQFAEIVSKFHVQAKYNTSDNDGNSISLCMNVCSVPLGYNNLFVIAYRDVLLNVGDRTLIKSKKITICEEFTVTGNQYSVRRFIGEENMYLINDFENNIELIKEIITKNNPSYDGVDDIPYLMAISRTISFNPEYEYGEILKKIKDKKETEPIKAFLGQLKRKPVRRKNYPLALFNDRVNIDQLRVIHDGIKYPLIYVQGPPGTGKTNTILNTIFTAFFSNKTVLVTSYNNHPIDEIFNQLNGLSYYGKKTPFPVVRLGNNDKVKKAIENIREMYFIAKDMKVFGSTLDRKHSYEEELMNHLSELLKNYETLKEAQETKGVLEMLINTFSDYMPVWSNLQTQQLTAVNQTIEGIPAIADGDIDQFINRDKTELIKYIHYYSAKKIQQIVQPKYEILYGIVFNEYENEDVRIQDFNKYLNDEDNMKGFLNLFPIVLTTNISAHKLGNPEPYFDMVIMDEASQCSTAMALIPIIRGKQLMLVGDPQQLQPVILLDPLQNKYLREKYDVSDEYDYIKQSVYKTFLSVDPVSDEVLLRYHYRCHPDIIGFNNKKYYNSKLVIKSEIRCESPLQLIDCKSVEGGARNTNISEAAAIINYIQNSNEKNIGIVTPFVNQKRLIDKLLKDNNIKNVSCGTVHAYQGDEKSTIIFSLGVSTRTGKGTYRWLKNNKELINVATSRAKDRFVLVCDSRELYRLHQNETSDDLYELYEYVNSGGQTYVSPIVPDSRALGIKPYDDETENIFLNSLKKAISQIVVSPTKYQAKASIGSAIVFNAIRAVKFIDDKTYDELTRLFYGQEFDYIIYEKIKKDYVPILVIEITNANSYKEESDVDERKATLCESIGLQIIKVPNNYVRRYNYIKDMLTNVFNNLKNI